MCNRIIIGISGASGVIYGIKMLQVLKKIDIETHLIISNAGKINIGIETNYNVEKVMNMADFSYENNDITAPVASGSFLTKAMVIAPCSIKTLSGIANSYTENLLIRAADVTLKEDRKIVLMVRETPLHKGHLKLMTQAADMGIHILPPVPSFYNQPKTIDDIINHSIGKALDIIGIEHNLFMRWQGDWRRKNSSSTLV
ncbi:MAG: 3-octaprenyl-4-hydroxybenzoate carboxy-lyase [Desulfobacteraceae bacterium 4572_130]|nr:MAG: 3-octaprenyl-4-hydroxybenzoate carboxy-lyase [Desulfobacteraceae bacterium 4572_130]